MRAMGAAVVLWSGAAWADPPADERARAEAEAAYEAHHYDDAITRYTALFARTRSMTVLARLAQIEQADERWRVAWTHYEMVLRTEGDAWVEAHRDELTAAQRRVDTHLGRLQVEVTPRRSWIRLGSEALQMAPLDAHVEPGAYVVTAWAAGYERESREIEVPQGETATLTIDLLPRRVQASNERYQRALATQPGLSYAVPVGWIVMGGLTAGLALVGLSLGTSATVAINDRPQCDAEGGPLCNRLLFWQVFGFAGAGVMMLLAVPSLIRGISGAMAVHERRRATAISLQSSLELTSGPGDLGVGVLGRF